MNKASARPRDTPAVAAFGGSVDEEDRILLERSGRLARIWLSRPERMNALTLRMCVTLREVLASLDADDTVWCILIRGAGSHFCSGIDVHELTDGGPARERARLMANALNSASEALLNCRQPTVAQVSGACLGGGLQLASLCDIRICSWASRFGLPMNRLGATTDYDGLRMIRDAMGPRLTRELLLEGRIYSAEQAYAKGLVTRIVATDDLEREIAHTTNLIVGSAPLVNRRHKGFLRRLGDAAPLSEEEREEPFLCYDSEDFAEGMSALCETRRPSFRGR